MNGSPGAGTAAWPRRCLRRWMRCESSPAGRFRLSSRSLRTARVQAKLPGVVAGAEESRVLPWPGQGTFDETGGQGHTARDAVVPPAQMVEDRRVTGEIVTRGNAVQVAGPARIRRLARQHPMDRERWFPSGCDIDRTIASYWPAPPGAGRCSQIRIPGTAVSIGLNSPRIFSGASGFMSNESCCPRPPLRRITITDRARPVVAPARLASRRQQARQPHSQKARIAHLDETATRQSGEMSRFRLEMDHVSCVLRVSPTENRPSRDNPFA